MTLLQAILDSCGAGGAGETSGQSSADQPESMDEGPAQPRDESGPTAQGAVPSSILDDAELRSLFIQTTEEDIEELSLKLLKLEEAADEEVTTEAFRIAHTIKSACGSAGLPDAHDLTHRMETLFDQLREGQLSVDDRRHSGRARDGDG